MGFAFSDFCVCPKCYGAVTEGLSKLHCSSCSNDYPIHNGIPMLLANNNDPVKQEYIECYDRLAETDLCKPVVVDREKSHKVLLSFIGDVRYKKVLDVGSSQAIYLRDIKAEFKVALDITFRYLLSIPSDTDVGRICADAEQLPIKPGFFDVIIISDILEHILEPISLLNRLNLIATPRTRIIVHVPWEEDLEPYTRMENKYTHLRKFTSYDIFILFNRFRLRRRRSSFPSLEYPIFMNLEPLMPIPIFNLFYRLYCRKENAKKEYERRSRWISQLPMREWWLLWFYKPKFRMFEFRLR